MASAGVPAIDSLPPELLEAILGFLDVPALCTARLVCAQLRGAASRCIHSVELPVETLRSRPETTLNNFSNLSRVTILDVKEDDFLMLAQSPVAAAVTHLRADWKLRPLPRRARIAAGLPLPPLPNLTSLSVHYPFYYAFLFPQTLRDLALEDPIGFRTAHLVTGLTNLTSLRIAFRRMHKPFEAVTALTALQRLEIRSELSMFPVVAQLTLLTHLQFRETSGRLLPSPLFLDLAPLASLSRLRRLVHLGVSYPGLLELGVRLEAEVLILASIATLSSLRSLDLVLCQRPQRSAFETVCMTPFSHLTALKLDCGIRGLDAPFLPRFNLERLQDLSLGCGVQLDRDGVVALRRATGLTHLHLWRVDRSGELEVGIALSRMSRLRALSLRTTTAFPTTVCGKAIRLLTELTRLALSGQFVITSADVEVCLGLKKLRVLNIFSSFSIPAPSDRLRPETFLAIAKLPELRRLYMCGECGISGERGISGHELGDNVRAWLNAERHDKGWPPVDLFV